MVGSPLPDLTPPEWLASRSQADSRRRERDVGAVTCLRTELSPCLCYEPPSKGRCANCRSGPRLQKVEPVSDPQALAFEIGRVGCSGVEEDRIKLVSHILDMAVRRLALRSEDSVISSVTNKSFRIPIAHPILSLRSFSRISGWVASIQEDEWRRYG
jgi:hypothetical protein